ncbi:hypothetical protein KI387_031601, partial [Taxus chinensis]
RKKQKVIEEADSEDMDSLEAYKGERDDGKEYEPEGAQEPPVFEVHDSEEEGEENKNEYLFMWRKGNQEGEGAQDKGESEQ